MTCEELQSDYTSFALGAADDPVREEIAEHLVRECPNCMRGVTSAMATVAAIGGAVEISQPPKHLRRRVMAAVEAKPRRPLMDTLVPWSIIAAMSVALIAFGLSGRRETGDAPRFQQALPILNDPATKDTVFGQQTAGQSGAGQSGAGRSGKAPAGRMFVNASKGYVFIGENLPRLESGKTFELWIIPSNGNPGAAGIFQSQPDGTAVVVRTGAITDADEFEVTIEPSHGSPQPTTSAILATKLNK